MTVEGMQSLLHTVFIITQATRIRPLAPGLLVKTKGQTAPIWRSNQSLVLCPQKPWHTTCTSVLLPMTGRLITALLPHSAATPPYSICIPQEDDIATSQPTKTFASPRYAASMLQKNSRRKCTHSGTKDRDSKGDKRSIGPKRNETCGLAASAGPAQHAKLFIASVASSVSRHIQDPIACLTGSCLAQGHSPSHSSAWRVMGLTIRIKEH